jgi:predicted phage terminase large subunit-like protein
MLRTDKINFYDPEDLPSDLQMCRAYDLASSKKERIKDDPDYTVGIKGGVKLIPTAIAGVSTPIMYIDDIVRGQWEALQRKKIIVDTAIADGSIRIGIEAFGAYKDAYTEIRDILHGIRTVENKQLPGDKVAKASCLEPICEAGNLWISNKIPKNIVQSMIDEFTQFPSGTHDDIVDACSVLYNMTQTGGFSMYTKEMYDADQRKIKENA